MANKTIPQLPAALELNGTEQIEAVQAGGSVRVAAAQIAALGGPPGPTGPAGGPTGPTGPAGGPTGPQGPPGTAGLVDLQIGGNTTGTTALISTGTFTLAGGPNVTLSQNGNAVSISAGGGIGGSFGASTLGNTVGNTGTTQGQLILAGINNITLSQATDATGATVTISGPTLTNSSFSAGLSNIGNTSGNTGVQTGQLVIAGGNNVTLSGSTAAGGAQTITISGAALTSFSAGVSNIGNTSGNTGTQTGQLVFAGGNNITLSVSTAAGGAQTITISGPNAAGAQTGISGIVVSNTTYTSGTVSFSNANGISFGSSAGQAITASYTVPATAGLISALAVSGGAGNSNTVTGMTFSNSNGITFGVSTGASAATITASYTVPTQTNQTLGVIASNQTTAQSSSTTFDARSFTVSGAGIVSAGMSTTAAGAPVLVISATTVAQTVQSLGVIASNQTTAQSSSTTFDARSFTVSGAGIVSAGMSTTAAGAPVLVLSATQSNQAVSAQGGSSAFQTLVFTNSNNVSFSNTGGSVWGSYALNVSAGGGTSNALSAITFSNSNGVTFGLSTGAGVGTMTASVAADITTAAYYFTNQTIGQSSSSTIGNQTISYGFSGAISGGLSNSSILLSVPQTSSLVGTSGLTVSVNASTLSVYPVAVSRVVWPPGQLTAISAPGNASASVQYLPLYDVLNCSRVDAMVGWSGSSTASAVTCAIAISAYCAVYTRMNSSQLGSVSSGSTQTTYSYASNTAGATGMTQSAVRPISVPVNISATPGEYWVAFNFITAQSSVGAATTALGQTLSMYGGNVIQTGINPILDFTNATATSNGLMSMGVYASATTGLPATISASALAQTGSSLSQANIALVLRSY